MPAPTGERAVNDVEEIQTVFGAALLVTRDLELSSTDERLATSTVTLTDPVVARLDLVAELTVSDGLK